MVRWPAGDQVSEFGRRESGRTVQRGQGKAKPVRSLGRSGSRRTGPARGKQQEPPMNLTIDAAMTTARAIKWDAGVGFPSPSAIRHDGGHFVFCTLGRGFRMRRFFFFFFLRRLFAVVAFGVVDQVLLSFSRNRNHARRSLAFTSLSSKSITNVSLSFNEN